MRFTLSAPDELIEKYRQYCRKEGKKMSQEFQNFMEDELSGASSAFDQLSKRVKSLEEWIKEDPGRYTAEQKDEPFLTFVPDNKENQASEPERLLIDSPDTDNEEQPEEVDGF